jgi:hypothetical protein
MKTRKRIRIMMMMMRRKLIFFIKTTQDPIKTSLGVVIAPLPSPPK